MRTWEFTARFRTDVEPRADITKEQIEDRIVPYLFPRQGNQVRVLGSALTRIDDERTADGNPTR